MNPELLDAQEIFAAWDAFRDVVGVGCCEADESVRAGGFCVVSRTLQYPKPDQQLPTYSVGSIARSLTSLSHLDPSR